MMELLKTYVFILSCVFIQPIFSDVEGDSPGCEYIRNRNESCQLPDCYCDYDDAPGTIPRGSSSKAKLTLDEVPQFVMFSYGGPVTADTRRAIIDVFPQSIKNPNGCSVDITMFVSGTNTSDFCAVHRLYVRGHEIGTNGATRGDPGDAENGTRWKDEFVKHREFITLEAPLPTNHIGGARAPKLYTGGDWMYGTLSKEDFFYDSSLYTYTNERSKENGKPVWPFTLDFSFGHVFCGDDIKRNNKQICPSLPFPGFWEIPVERLNLRSTKYCPFYECTTALSSKDKIFELLKTNFHRHLETNKAPFHVPLDAKSLESQPVREALKEFLNYITGFEEVWVVTMQTVLDWMILDEPLNWFDLAKSSIVSCDNRMYFKCNSNSTRERPDIASAFVGFMDVESIWIWQAVAYIVIYLILYQYDKTLDKKKK